MRSMAVFAVVVEEGSFKAAGEKLGLSSTVVSQHITRLQEQVGHVLLVRGTRKMVLTDEGQILYVAARNMVHVAKAGLDRLTDVDRVPTGNLRINMPVFLSGGILQEIVEDFLLSHPKVSIELDFVKELSHPANDNYDLAVTTSRVKGNLVSYRKIVGAGAAFYAAPDLADRISVIPTQDIPLKIPILLGADYSSSDWAAMFFDGAKGMLPNIQFRIKCDDIGLIHKLCTSGAGLAILPKSRALADVASGRLVPVLQEINLIQVEFFALWATNSHKSELILSFLDHVDDSLNRMMA